MNKKSDEQRLFEIKENKKTNRENIILGVVTLIALAVIFFFKRYI